MLNLVGAYAHETSFQHNVEMLVIQSDQSDPSVNFVGLGNKVRGPKDVEVRGWDAAAGRWVTIAEAELPRHTTSPSLEVRLHSFVTDRRAAIARVLIMVHRFVRRQSSMSHYLSRDVGDWC